jgi:hypothetical protein
VWCAISQATGAPTATERSVANTDVRNDKTSALRFDSSVTISGVALHGTRINMAMIGNASNNKPTTATGMTPRGLRVVCVLRDTNESGVLQNVLSR